MKTRIFGLLMVFAASMTSGVVMAQSKTFKIATIAPAGSDWMNQMKAGAEEINERTQGRVKFKFYGGGVMGNDKKVLRKIRSGQLHGAAFTAGGLAEKFNGMNLYGLPFLFNDLDEVTAVRTQFDDYLTEGLRNAGLVSFGFAGGGFAQIMSNKPVKNIGDLKGQRVWIPEGDLISYHAMEKFGLSPVTMPTTDVLTGLQTGLIDVIGSSAIGALVLQWHTKVSHISTLPVSYLYASLVVEDKHFNKLSTEDQHIVSEVFTKVYKNFDTQNNIDNKKALEALQTAGLDLVEPDEGLLVELQAVAASLNEQLVKEGLIPQEKLQEMQALLSAYRTNSDVSSNAHRETTITPVDRGSTDVVGEVVGDVVGDISGDANRVFSNHVNSQ